MKAIVYTQYGPPEMLQLQDVDKPIPTDNQVLIKVHAASINALDWRRFEASAFMASIFDKLLTKSLNTVLGVDVAGTVEAVGKEVTQFKPGDAVFGVAPGAFAEYACNGQSKFALKPANVSFEQAAAVPVGAFTALQALRDKCHLQSGQKILIYGASGSVGVYAVQMAKAFGAEVTAVCSTRNLEMARSIGADYVIDYKREDFTKNGQQYDVILGVNGYRSIFDYQRALRPNGRYISAGGSFPQIIQVMLLGRVLSKFGNKTLDFMGIANTDQKDLLVLRELLETGKITPMIDRCYPLSETPQAFRYVVNEHTQGKVVITMTSAHNA